MTIVKLKRDIEIWERIREKNKLAGKETKNIDIGLKKMYEQRRNYGLHSSRWNISKDSEEFIKRLQTGEDKLLSSLFQKENEMLYEKYSQLYRFFTYNKEALFEEVVAQIYNGTEVLENLEIQNNLREELNTAIKDKFGIADIRYSLEDGSKGYDKYSKGQIVKYIAEHSKKIAYSRADSEKVVNTIVAQTLSFGEKYGEIGKKTKEQKAELYKMSGYVA